MVLYFTMDGADMDWIWLQSKANSCLQPAAAGAKNGQALPGNILWGMAWHEEETKCKIWYQPQPTLGYRSLLRSTSTFHVAWFLCGECGNFLMCYPSSVAAPHHPPCLQHMVQRSLSASKPPCSYSLVTSPQLSPSPVVDCIAELCFVVICANLFLCEWMQVPHG